jgi:hypothetical protein
VPSTYSNNLRLELIASGEQGNTWGNTTNNNLGTLIEQAISGYRSIDTGWSSNACTLTALNGANDQSRNMYLDIPSSVSLSAEGQLTAPTVPKVYAIRNNTSGGYAVRIKTGASTTTCLIPNGATKVVVCDGTNFSEAVTSAADFYIANTPTTSLQATNKSYVDTADNLRLKRDGTQNMTGELVLSAGTEPSNALAAVSKTYVANTYLAKAGGTMTGAITLPSVAPSSTWQAVPKTYVDGLIPGIATTSATGVVKIGAGLSIAGDGTLTVSAPSGVSSVTATSPIVNNGTSANVNLGMIANAYYPYTGNPAGYVTSSALSSASVNFAANAGSASTATTATYLNGSTARDWSTLATSSPTTNIYGTTYRTSSTGAAAVTCIHSAGSNTGAPLVIARTNTGNTGGIAGTGIAFAFGANVISGAAINIDSSSAVSYLTGSDYRLKDNITPISGALDRVLNINPVSFVYKANSSTVYEGFIAHELAPLAPYAVNGQKDAIDEEGNPVYQGVDQAKLVPLLAAAIRELSAQVTTLTAEVEALKGA